MAFGPLSVLAVLAGPLWLLGYSLKENSEIYDAKHRHENEQLFIDKYADEELERSVRRYVNLSKNQDEMYCYLEKFKKENSRWCARNEIPVTEERYTSCGDKEYYKVPEMYRIDWYNIGKIRFDFKYNPEDSKKVRLHYVENVNRAVEMIMNSLSVWTIQQAACLFSEKKSAKNLHLAHPPYESFHYHKSICPVEAKVRRSLKITYLCPEYNIEDDYYEKNGYWVRSELRK